MTSAPIGPLRAIIVAVSPEGVIGRNGTIPWHHPGDLKRLKRVTMGTTVVMGRSTWDSVGRPLPGRRNIVVTTRPLEGVECITRLSDVLSIDGPVWFLGGARVYQEAMPWCDLLDITYVPDHVEGENLVRFPAIDPQLWTAGDLIAHEDEAGLSRRIFTRKH